MHDLISNVINYCAWNCDTVKLSVHSKIVTENPNKSNCCKTGVLTSFKCYDPCCT